MARDIGPKDKLSRREGFDLFGKGAKLTRINVLPGVHGPKGGPRNVSQFGRQLREKQKVKRLYGIKEKQFKRYIDEAMKTRTNTVDALFSRLEKRLDNVVYRLGFAKTRPQARQLVGHRHVLVNNKRLNISSYQVGKGEMITLNAKAMEIPSVKKELEQKNKKVPAWLKRKAGAGQMISEPTFADVTEPVSAQDIIEFYSR